MDYQVRESVDLPVSWLGTEGIDIKKARAYELLNEKKGVLPNSPLYQSRLTKLTSGPRLHPRLTVLENGMYYITIHRDDGSTSYCDNEYRKVRGDKKFLDDLRKHYDKSFGNEEYPPEEAKRIRDRFELIYTPKHGSWLNMAEIELNVLMGQCLNRRIDNIHEVQREVNAWQSYRNNKETAINWRFTNKEARIKLKKLYPTILD